MRKIISKLKFIMNGYNREMETINMQMRSTVKLNNLSNAEKYIKNCDNAISTNSIFY